MSSLIFQSRNKIRETGYTVHRRPSKKFFFFFFGGGGGTSYGRLYSRIPPKGFPFNYLEENNQTEMDIFFGGGGGGRGVIQV